jgi:hypothetical protein
MEFLLLIIFLIYLFSWLGNLYLWLVKLPLRLYYWVTELNGQWDKCHYCDGKGVVDSGTRLVRECITCKGRGKIKVNNSLPPKNERTLLQADGVSSAKDIERLQPSSYAVERRGIKPKMEKKKIGMPLWQITILGVMVLLLIGILIVFVIIVQKT